MASLWHLMHLMSVYVGRSLYVYLEESCVCVCVCVSGCAEACACVCRGNPRPSKSVSLIAEKTLVVMGTVMPCITPIGRER